MSFEKPPHIKNAVTKNDTELLRAAGRKGAEKTNELKRHTAELAEMEIIMEERLREKAAEADIEQSRKANYHILSPDGEDTTD